MKHAPVIYEGGNVQEKHNEENVLFRRFASFTLE